MKPPDEVTERVFGEALDLPREERDRFLDGACRGAPELRRAVEELLAENDRLSGFQQYATNEAGGNKTVAVYVLLKYCGDPKCGPKCSRD